MWPATRVSPTWTANLGSNVRRFMADRGMTLGDLSAATGLDQRTLRGILHRRSQPQARTVNKLAAGLEVTIDELFIPPGLRQINPEHVALDRATNPVVAEVIAEQPGLFAGWTAAEFDELFSQVGVGGALTSEGVQTAAESIERRRELWTRAAVVLETDLGDLLGDMIDLLYDRVTASPMDPTLASSTKMGCLR